MNNKNFIGYIYHIKDLQRNKCYIGQHYCKCINDNYFSSGKIIRRIVNKHGKLFLKKTIIGYIEANSLNELKILLNKAEIECIYFFRSYGSNGLNHDQIYGYNFTKGGDGGKGGWDHMKGLPPWNKNLNKYTDDRVKKYGLSGSSNKKGIPLSESHRQKIKDNALIGEKSPRFIKINDITKEKIHDLYIFKKLSILEISKICKISRKKITQILLEKNVTLRTISQQLKLLYEKQI